MKFKYFIFNTEIYLIIPFLNEIKQMLNNIFKLLKRQIFNIKTYPCF